MDKILFTFGVPFTGLGLLLAACGLALALLIVIAISVLRAGSARALEAALVAERQNEADDKMAELTRLNAELTGRLRSMAEVMTSRQTDLARIMADRLDAVGARVGQGLEQGARSTADHLAKLGERLAVIDRAQEGLTGLTKEMLGLKEILANKQSRGAFGQGRMEAIVRDNLSADAFAFQHVLSNRNRPDCVIRLPGDDRLMVVDAKFPLEAFTAFRAAECQAKSPVRTLEKLDVSRQWMGQHGEIVIETCARSFLHHQVRAMVGTLMLAGCRRLSADDVADILATGDKTRCGPLAPACGLTFVGVDYT